MVGLALWRVCNLLVGLAGYRACKTAKTQIVLSPVEQSTVVPLGKSLSNVSVNFLNERQVVVYGGFNVLRKQNILPPGGNDPICPTYFSKWVAHRLVKGWFLLPLQISQERYGNTTTNGMKHRSTVKRIRFLTKRYWITRWTKHISGKYRLVKYYCDLMWFGY